MLSLSQEPLISCVMPTYGRPDFVHESVKMFLDQDYPKKELIILNDCAGQRYQFTLPEVRVFNLDTKFATLGEKRNAAIELSGGEVIAVWDDDDVYLPWHLSFSLAEMRKHQTPLYRPTEYWAWWGNNFGFHHNQAIRGWMHHAMILFTRDAWQRVGGYPAMDVREDAEFIDHIAGQLGIPFQRFPVNVFDRSFILRGKSKYAHMSMKGGNNPLDTSQASIQINPIDIADEQLRFHRDQLIRVHTESGETKKIVIGLGSGRCGTTSLAALLGLPHEQCEPLPWQVNEQELLRRLSVWKSGKVRVVGDVGFYYLPYVKLLREHADCRFICLKRKREDTIDSFMRHSAGANHWTNHDGKRWRSDPHWDLAFPKYEMGSKAEAIGRYWDEYYEMASALSASDDFLLLETEALNDSGKCEEILEFAGICRKAVVGLNLNPGK